MDVKNLIIWVCLGGAGVLILAEIIAYLLLAWHGVKALNDASKSLETLAGAQQMLAKTLNDPDPTVRGIVDQLPATQLTAVDAAPFLEKIAELLKALSAKVPLLVGAIVLLLLAAFLAGVITVSATVGTSDETPSTTQTEGN